MADAPAYDIDFYCDDVIRAPLPHYAAMRELGPVVYLPRNENYALTQNAEVCAALRDHERFSSASGVAGDAFGCEHLQGNTVASDPPRHGKLRKAMAPPLMPRALENLKPNINRTSAELIQNLVERESFDTPRDLSRHLPFTIVREMVGLPDHGQERMLKWAAAAFDVLGCQNTRGREGLDTIQEMRSFIGAEIVREKVRPESWTARILDLVEAGELDEAHAPFVIRDYINPSLDTTISATSQLIWQLSQNPEAWQTLRDDPALCRKAVNEAVRLGTPIRSFTRTTTRNVQIGEVTIPSGSRVMMLFASANRDERVYRNPDQFDLSRPAQRHLGFGLGIHMCVGMHLAQLEMIALLEAMIPRVERIHCEEPTVVLNNTISAIDRMETRLVSR